MTLNDRLQQFFLAHPGEWIDGRTLETVAGAYAWRSRVSDLRVQRGMTLNNRCRRVEVQGRKFTVSEYRYVPSQEPAQATLFEARERRDRVNA